MRPKKPQGKEERMRCGLEKDGWYDVKVQILEYHTTKLVAVVSNSLSNDLDQRQNLKYHVQGIAKCVHHKMKGGFWKKMINFPLRELPFINYHEQIQKRQTYNHKTKVINWSSLKTIKQKALPCQWDSNRDTLSLHSNIPMGYHQKLCPYLRDESGEDWKAVLSMVGNPPNWGAILP